MTGNGPDVGRSGDLPLHVEEAGEGRPVVFIHGFGGSSPLWRRWNRDLVRDHRTLLVDLKGFGSAPKPDDGRYGPVDQAELVARLIVDRNLTEATLVGHSLGGGLALLATLLLRDRGEGHRVARLVSVAGAAYRQSLPFYISRARRPHLARALLSLTPRRWLVRTVMRSIFHDRDAVSEELVRALAEPLAEPAARRALVESALHIVPTDIEGWVARYPEIDQPTLLLWGREDRVVPVRVGQRLAVDLPRARLVVIPECGHVPFEEKPRESLAALRSFLASTADAARERAGGTGV